MKRYRVEVVERFVVYVDAETETEAKAYIEEAAPIPKHEGIIHDGREYKLTEQKPEYVAKHSIEQMTEMELDLLEIYRLQRSMRRGELTAKEWQKTYDYLRYLYNRFRTKYGHSYKRFGGYSHVLAKGMRTGN